jgi:2-dehydro-3-deoxyphosphogluconate aldolase/(4S)-4-hydroxy-2-oxoglutarate aldolase
LKAAAAPYLHLGIRFVPLGGVNGTNMASYLADPLIAAIGGSWLAPKEMITIQDWAGITARAAAAVANIRTSRTRPSL